MLGGKTIVEKIVSRAVGRNLGAGDFVDVLPIDKLYFNEVIAPPAINNFESDFSPVYQEVTNQKSNQASITVGKSKLTTGILCWYTHLPPSRSARTRTEVKGLDR